MGAWIVSLMDAGREVQVRSPFGPEFHRGVRHGNPGAYVCRTRSHAHRMLCRVDSVDAAAVSVQPQHDGNWMKTEGEGQTKVLQIGLYCASSNTQADRDGLPLAHC